MRWARKKSPKKSKEKVVSTGKKQNLLVLFFVNNSTELSKTRFLAQVQMLTRVSKKKKKVVVFCSLENIQVTSFSELVENMIFRVPAPHDEWKGHHKNKKFWVTTIRLLVKVLGVLF